MVPLEVQGRGLRAMEADLLRLSQGEVAGTDAEHSASGHTSQRELGFLPPRPEAGPEVQLRPRGDPAIPPGITENLSLRREQPRPLASSRRQAGSKRPAPEPVLVSV